MQVTGSLQIKNGTYYSVLWIQDEAGKTRHKWQTTKIKVAGKNCREEKRNRQQAEKELQRRILEYENRTTVASDVLFITWLDEWMERNKGSIRLNSWEAYEIYADKHIKPYFEPLHLKITEVTPYHIQKYIDKKYKDGQSAKSIQKHLVVIHGVMQEALKFNVIPFDPSDRVTLPRLERHVGKAYTVEQANQLIRVLKDEPAKPAVMLGLFLGLRRSEVLGLRWQDIDFDKDIVHIRNTVVRTKTLIEHEETKSQASKRDLILMPALKTYLLQVKAGQENNRELMGSSYVESDHVCVWPDGRLLSPDYVTHRFSDILEVNNLPHIKFHELRHSAGSILIEQGQSAKQVQEYLGHEKIATTLDIYTHLSAEGKREAANVLNSILESPLSLETR